MLKPQLIGRLSFDEVYDYPHYLTLKRVYKKEYEVSLPHASLLDFEKVWRICNKPFTIKVGNRSYLFEVGFITDFLSIPDPLASYHRSDSNIGKLAGLVHDADFSFKLDTFKAANKRFYKALRGEGMSYLKAKTFYIAVTNKKGAQVYNTHAPKDSIQRVSVYS